MSKHVGSGQARTGKVRLIVEDSSYPLGQLRIHGITGLQSHVSEEVAGPSGWYAVARIDRQTQDRLAINAQPQQSALQLEKLVLGVGAGRKCDCRPDRYSIDFGAQAVGFHIYIWPSAGWLKANSPSAAVSRRLQVRACSGLFKLTGVPPPGTSRQ